MAKRYLLNKKKKNLKIKTWIYDVARLTAAWKNYGAPVEKLCWSCLSPTLNLFHPPCPLRLKLLGSSMALLLGKLLKLPFSGRRWTRLFRLFWPVFFLFAFLFCLFQTCHLPLPSNSSDLFPSLYYLELCQVPYLPFCISISSFLLSSH